MSNEDRIKALFSATPQTLAAVDSALSGDKKVADGPGRALNLTAAAHRAGVSRCTIWRAIKKNSLKASPLFHGGRPRVTESELNRWLTGAAE